jgi:putative membrane protein
MKLLTDEDNKKIEAVIRKAESMTSGEIVFATAEASSRYRHATIQGAVFGMAIITAVYLAIPHLVPGTADFPIFAHTTTHLLWAEFLAFAFFYVVLPYTSWRRWIISQPDMDARVYEAAFMQFYSSGLFRTRDSNGIEIFLSFFEREVVVIGDRAINEKMGEQHWNKVRDLIIQGIKRGKACEGICAAIESCGQALAQHFPRKPDDTNELPDSVIHRPLDPRA